MPQVNVDALANARREALTLAEAGLRPDDVVADLRRRGVAEDLASTAARAAGAEVLADIDADFNRGKAYAIAEVIVAIVAAVLFPASNMLPPPAAGPATAIVFAVALQGVLLAGRAWLRRSKMTAWQNVADPLPGLGVSRDDLRSDSEMLRLDADRHRRGKRALRMAAILGVIVGFSVGGLIWGTGVGQIAVLVVSAIAYFPLWAVFRNVEGLGGPLPASPNMKTATAEGPVVYKVGKLAAAPNIPLAEVPRSSRLRVWRTLSGEVLGEKTKKGEQKFVQGVLYGTTLGISFLPDLENELVQTLLVVGQPAAQVVGDVLNVKQLADFAQAGGEIAGEKQSHEAWLNRSIANKWHYAIPWPELVQVEYNPQHRYVIMTRHPPDDIGVSYLFRQVDRSFAGRLMSARLLYERNLVAYSLVLAGKIEELRKQVRQEMLAVFKDRIDEHQEAMDRETQRRLDDWFAKDKPDISATVRKAMAPHIERYRGIPEVLEDHADLFVAAPATAQAQAAPAPPSSSSRPPSTTRR